MCFISFKGKASKTTWAGAADAMGRASPRLERQLDTLTTGEVGVLVRPSSDQTPSQAKAEVERAITAVDRIRFTFDVMSDDTGHAWVILKDRQLENLAAGTAQVGEALTSSGLGERVVAAVFPFRWRDNQLAQDRKIYWIYQPRLQAYTPFAPVGDSSREERDHPFELRMESAIRRDLPTYRRTEEWYPIWGMPV